MAGKAIFITLPLAPPITSFLNALQKLVIGGADSNSMKIAFPAILASPKAQNLIVPSKIDEPLSQIPNSAQG